MQKRIDQLLIQTNLWVAICVCGLLAFTQIMLHEIDLARIGFLFGGTITIYNFTRFYTLQRSNQSKFHQSILLSFLGLVMAGYCFLNINLFPNEWIYIGVLSLVSVFYSLPFKPIGLRFISCLKIFLIGLVWTGMTVGWVSFYTQNYQENSLLLLAYFVFLIGITIPFDIRDYKIDNPNLKTIPQLVGAKNANLLAVLSLILSLFLFEFNFGWQHEYALIWNASIIISIVIIMNSLHQKSNFYYAFYIESCSLIPLIILMITRIFKT